MDQEELKALKAYFLGALVTKENARVRKLLAEIQDTHALKYGCRAFMLDGKPVWNGDAVAARQGQKKPLDLPLQDDARRYVAKLNKIRVDEQRLTNFFGTVSQRCFELQDFRDVLPDMVVERMEPHEISLLPRTREPGYAFTSSPAKAKLYQDGVDIMLHYLVNELVF